MKTRSHLSIDIMNVYTQANWDKCCALFGFVAVTCLLFDGDHKTVVLDQKELCLHFIKILETNLVALFLHGTLDSQ